MKKKTEVVVRVSWDPDDGEDHPSLWNWKVLLDDPEAEFVTYVESK